MMEAGGHLETEDKDGIVLESLTVNQDDVGTIGSDGGSHQIMLDESKPETKPSELEINMEDAPSSESKQTKSGICCCNGSDDSDEFEEPKVIEPKVGFFELFRFSDTADKLMMLGGVLFMAGLGVATPLNIFFFGDLITLFTQYELFLAESAASAAENITTTLATTVAAATAACPSVTETGEALSGEAVLDIIVTRFVPSFIGIGVGAFICAYVGMTFWTWTGNRQVRRIRTTYFNAVMRQSVGWFDVNDAGEIGSRMVEDMERLNEGFGDKIGTFIQNIATFIGGFILGFITSWKLTLVVLACSPLLVIVAAALGRFLRTFVKKELLAYAKAGSVAEETFSSIRTVAAFGGEKKAEQRYSEHLQHALKEGVRKGTIGGLTGGLFWLIIFCVFGLALWYGGRLTREECLDSGAILQVLFGVLIGASALGNAVPSLDNFGNARAAAASIFKTIDEKIEIDGSSEEGLKPETLEGTIEFKDVGFTYPARKDIKILNGLNLSVKKGQTVALVGESGCGKSTTIQLLQRYYECDEGSVLIDGKDLRDYNITYLRNYMGIVSQEPVLFATSIGENIRLGAKYGDEVTQEQIETACRQANCYDFISQMPQGFDTLVGDRGAQLSGGQKQRIAIARALIRNPSILLLDEATSALDTQSEGIVQDALDKASEGRTTIVIAHRLSTVKNANKIFAFKKGVVYEEGTHEELMAKEGLYHSLATKQNQIHHEEQQERKHDLEASSKLVRKRSRISRQGSSGSLKGSIKRSSSMRQSKRSIRSLIDIPTDGFNHGLGTQFDEDDELAIEGGMVVTERVLSVVEEEEEEEQASSISSLEIFQMNKPEWGWIFLGTLGAMVTGTVQLAFALLMSEIIGALSLPDHEEQERQVNLYVIYIVAVGVGSALAALIQNAALALSGERLTLRLRQQSFAAILRQDMGYFDDEKNSVGFLTSRLSSSASLVKGATGVRVGVLAQSFTTIVGALIISFVFVWELALAVMAFIPLMILAGMVQQNLLAGYSRQDKASAEEGGMMAQEAIINMRTVTALNRQRYFSDKYFNHFKGLYKSDMKQSFVYGIAFGVSSSMTYFMYAICFGLGGFLVVCDCTPYRAEPIPFFHILRTFACVTFGSMAVGRAASSLPDYGKAKLAAAAIRDLINKPSPIDPTDPSGEQPSEVEGKVKFTDVEFKYPTRPTIPILQGVSFTIDKGETLALVGASGCGKSTSVGLLERFYNAANGTVEFDGRNVHSLNLKWLRQRIGLVSQEPILFDTTIAENIAYGDNSREVTMDEIIDATTKANAHNFITGLPDGYNTNVGAKGTQLSGGQKQRIAIARALIRNPSLMLLDEATSALDTESEKIVQEALDDALKGRTAVIIAHRLSTIKNATKIGVIDKGKIAEIGTHQELLNKKGQYFNLVNAQSL